MPFVISNRPATAGKAVEATLCSPNALGLPDRRSKGVPILIRKISERILLIEPDDPREIIATHHRDGQTTFTVGSTRSPKALAEGVRRARLQQACELLDQLRRVLTALPADNSAQHHLAALEAWVNCARQAGVRNRPPEPGAANVARAENP